MGDDKGAALRDLRAFAWMRRTLWIGMGLATVQQVTGINTVNYYAPTILESTGLGTSAALTATIAVGVTSVVMTLVGIVLLGYFNRRPLLLIGFSGVAGPQLVLALSFLLPESTFRSYFIGWLVPVPPLAVARVADGLVRRLPPVAVTHCRSI